MRYPAFKCSIHHLNAGFIDLKCGTADLNAGPRFKSGIGRFGPADPEAHLVAWIRERAPIGVARPIEPSGVFPLAEPRTESQGLLHQVFSDGKGVELHQHHGEQDLGRAGVREDPQHRVHRGVRFLGGGPRKAGPGCSLPIGMHRQDQRRRHEEAQVGHRFLALQGKRFRSIGRTDCPPQVDRRRHGPPDPQPGGGEEPERAGVAGCRGLHGRLPYADGAPEREGLPGGGRLRRQLRNSATARWSSAEEVHH